MGLLIFFGIFAIGVSFLCSLLEACLLSLSRSYVESLVEQGSRTGKILRRMKENIDRPLAAILTLNTIAHTVGAAGVGAQSAIVFGSATVGIASAIMTLLILVFSEIIPKTLGAVHAEALAPAAAVMIQAMILICLPIIIPLEWMNRLIGYQRGKQSLSRAELVATIRMGYDSRAIRKQEYRIALNLIALNEIPLQKILTPRTVVFEMPDHLSIREALEQHHPLRFARIPIYTGHANHITGYVTRMDLYEPRSEEASLQPLKSIARPISVYPELASVSSVLEEMITTRQHIALVVDEYGEMAGIAALEDMLEALLGVEIVDETDQVVDMQELARRRMAPRMPKKR